MSEIRKVIEQETIWNDDQVKRHKGVVLKPAEATASISEIAIYQQLVILCGQILLVACRCGRIISAFILSMLFQKCLGLFLMIRFNYNLLSSLIVLALRSTLIQLCGSGSASAAAPSFFQMR